MAEYRLARVWASIPWVASTTSTAPSHAFKRAADLVAEIHMAGGIDQVELIRSHHWLYSPCAQPRP